MISTGFFGGSLSVTTPPGGSPVEGEAASRPADGAGFPAVLVALASIGTPLHALPTAAPAERGPDARASETAVLFLSPAEGDPAGDATGALAVDEDSAVMVELVWPGPPSCGECVEMAQFDGLAAVAEHDAAGGLAPDVAAPTPPGAVGEAVPFDPAALIHAPAPVDHAEPVIMSASLKVPVDATLEVPAAERPQLLPGPAAGVAAADTVTLDGGMIRGMSRAFVPRLERVAERMWNEHGLRIDIVEGYRSQSRQDALFAQGRSAEGPVVTWTRKSLHTTGAAADVYVDGAPVTPQQALVLSRVAAEEGLRTLYPYDSGHIQMEGTRTAGPDTPGDQSLPDRGGTGPEVRKGVARVAPVARLARPPRPGGIVMRGTGPSASAEGVEDAQAPRIESPDVARPGAAQVRNADAKAPAVNAQAMVVTEAASPNQPRISDSGAQSATPLQQTASAPALEPSSLSGGVAYRRLHLPIDGVGGTASLDLGIRPGGVDALLNITDPVLASDLRKNLHELRQTLADRGVDARGLTVRISEGAASEAVAGRMDVGQSARGFMDGTAGQSAGDGERGRAERFEQRFAEREDARSRRGHHKKEDQDATRR